MNYDESGDDEEKSNDSEMKPIVLDRFTLYSWHFLSSTTNISPAFDYKKILKKTAAYLLFPWGKEKNMAKIVRDRKSRKITNLDLALWELQALQRLTLCVQVPFPNPRAYMNFCNHYQKDIQNFLEQSEYSKYITYSVYFPVENFQQIQSKYKNDASFKLRQNTALVILLFDKEMNINDQIMKRIYHQLVEHLTSYRGPKGKGGNFLKEDSLIVHKKEEIEEPIEGLFELNLQDYYIYSKREIYKSIISKHFAKFFSEKRIYSSFREKPLNLITKGDESVRQVLTLETTKKVFNLFSDWIKKLISQISITEDLISLDKSVTILKNHEQKDFLRNYIDTHFVPKEYFKPPLLVEIGNIEERGPILEIRIFIVISGFHLKDQNQTDNDILKHQMVGKVQESLQSLITHPLSDPKTVEIIKDKFDKNFWKATPLAYYIYGHQSRVKEILDFLSKNSEEEIVTLSVNLKTGREIFIMEVHDPKDFKDFERDGLAIDFLNKSLVRFSGKKKIANKFKEFLQNYLIEKDNLVSIWTKNVQDSDEKEFWINKAPKITKLARNHHGRILPAKQQASNSILDLRMKDSGILITLVAGDITKQKGDILLNSISKDLNSNSNKYSVNSQVLSAAGEQFKKKLMEDLSKPSFLFAQGPLPSDAYELKTVQKIISMKTPAFSGQASLDSDEIENCYLALFTLCANTILPNKQAKTIVTPLLGAGVNSFPAERVFNGLIKALLMVNKYKRKDLSEEIDNVIIVENDQNKVMELKKYIESRMNSKKSIEYQWYWMGDDKVTFKKYDEDINDRINKAFEEKKPSFKIYFAPLRKPGTNKFDLTNMIFTDIPRRKQYRLINKRDAWGYENSETGSIMFEPKINEIIVANKLSGVLEFELFLKYYTLDFDTMIQTNEETKFQRSAKKELKETAADNNKWDEIAGKFEIVESKIVETKQILFKNVESQARFLLKYKESLNKYIKKKSAIQKIGSELQVKLCELKASNPLHVKDFQFLESNLRRSIPSAKITKAFRVENNHQRFHFELEKKKVGEDSKFLWHGTSNPDKVINDSVGFRINYAKDEGLYGRGLYFAQDASYSQSYGLVNDANQRTVRLFLSQVLLGKIYDQPQPTKFTVCPDNYHSIKGKSSSDIIYILYDQYRAYPEFYIEFTI